MAVGKAINLTMEYDPIDEVCGIGFEECFTWSAYEVAQQCSAFGSVGGKGEMEVSEEVQGLRA